MIINSGKVVMSLRVMLNHRMKSKHLLIRSQTSSFNSAEKWRVSNFPNNKREIFAKHHRKIGHI